MDKHNPFHNKKQLPGVFLGGEPKAYLEPSRTSTMEVFFSTRFYIRF